MSKIIKLSNTGTTIVDDDDYDWLSQWRWYCSTKGYAARSTSNHKVILMHREIMSVLEESCQIDHINHNKLDNRRINLRKCSGFQNQANRGMQKNNLSGFIGVSWYKPYKKWRAQITSNKKKITLGYFDNIIDAAKEYDYAAKELHKEFATTNF